jgi:Periplasmic copper-binding protein (NosD)
MHSRLRPLCLAVAMLALLAMAPSGAHGAQPSGPSILVTDGGDANVCPSQWTLRCAINFANANPFTNITFAPNIHTVVLSAALPTLSTDGTWIDGNNANPVVRIDGFFWDTSVTGTGSAFTITGSNVTLSNLTVVNIPGGQADIYVNGGHNANIDNDYLGILPGASQCGTDAPYGVLLDQDTAGTNTTDGDVAYIFGNTISCHGSYGIWVYFTNWVSIGVDEANNIIGNKIGTTSDGLHPAGNYSGIAVQGNASHNLNIRGNLIADNAHEGVTLNASANFNLVAFNDITGNGGSGIVSYSGIGNDLFGNNIGTNLTGTAVLPNGGDGIQISGGTGTFVSNNQIFYNHGIGVSVLITGTQAQIQNNRIGNNGGLPIDLNGDGPSPNGTHYGAGPNGWLEYPILTVVNGTSLFGVTCANCWVFIDRAMGNPQAPGGGGTPLTSTQASSGGAWAINLPAGMTRADVTLFAVDPSGETSEMSPRPQLMLPLVRR